MGLPEIRAYLCDVVGLASTVAEQYAASLVEEGFENVALVDDLSVEELKQDFGFKTGHARQVEKSQKERGAGRFAAPEPEPEVEEAAPAGNKLADGSTVTILDGEAAFLGRGASGIVQRGIMAPAGGGPAQDVACKMLAPGATEREHQNFYKEYDIAMQAAAKCDRAARTHGCFRCNGSLCLVMKMYSRSLRDVLEPPKDALVGTARVALTAAAAMDYGMQIAEGLAQLHSEKIKVGDLKPGNLLIDDDNRLVVADFGISAVASSSIVSTQSAASGGTPAYMSPEQLDSDLGEATSKVDIWAWGCIMYEMLAGNPPWHGKTPHQIMVDVSFKRRRLEVPLDVMLPESVRALIEGCFAYDAADRPAAAHVADVLAAELASDTTSLTLQHPGSPTYNLAQSLLMNTWVKKEAYELKDVIKVHEISNPRLQDKYNDYKNSISPPQKPDGVANGNELQVFHGCTEGAMDIHNPDSIVQTGFLKKYWKTSAGDWQRFGPGFYFGQQASKSHEYPLPEMRALRYGAHKRSMLLCKVARGRAFRTQENMDTLQGRAPEGYDSVHGDAREAGDLNYDEIVVYHEAAVLPFAIVEYTFNKVDPLAPVSTGSTVVTGGTVGGRDSRQQAGAVSIAGGDDSGALEGNPIVRRLSRVAVAGMVLEEKQQQMGADIAAEFALHGIEVHVWQPPELSCLVCSPNACAGGATCSPCPGEFSKHKVSEALGRAEAWMVAHGAMPSEPEPEEAGSPTTSILLSHPRFQAAEALVTGHDTPLQLVDGCDLVIENLADILEAKRAFFDSIAPGVGNDVFLTSTTATAKLNLSDITQASAPAAAGTDHTVHGLRFLLRKVPDGSAWTTVGTCAVELTSPHLAPGSSDHGNDQLQELAGLLACAGKVSVLPRRNKKKRGFDILCKKKLPLSHGSANAADDGQQKWRQDACTICGRGATQQLLCHSCMRDHSADRVVCTDAVVQTMQALHGGRAHGRQSRSTVDMGEEQPTVA